MVENLGNNPNLFADVKSVLVIIPLVTQPELATPLNKFKPGVVVDDTIMVR